MAVCVAVCWVRVVVSGLVFSCRYPTCGLLVCRYAPQCTESYYHSHLVWCTYEYFSFCRVSVFVCDMRQSEVSLSSYSLDPVRVITRGSTVSLHETLHLHSGQVQQF